MFTRQITVVIGGSLFLETCCISCVEYTPKPRGYVCIESSKAWYRSFDLSYLPSNFGVFQAAVIRVPDQKKGVMGLNISHPELETKLYCSYLPVTPVPLVTVKTENCSFVARLIKSEDRISGKAYFNPAVNVYNSLFLPDGESVSPTQFLLTDSVSNFFRGVLHSDRGLNVDSLAPAIQYIREDIIELI